MRGDGRRRVRSGDRPVIGPPGSFEAFYLKEVKSVLAVSLSLTRNRWEAEDVTQEAFYRAYRDWESLTLMDRPGAWVRRVALNLAVGRWRRMRREAVAVLKARGLGATTLSDPVSARFWSHVRALPKRQAQIVALTYVEDLDAEGVSEILGIAPSTVRVHLARARTALARSMGWEL